MLLNTIAEKHPNSFVLLLPKTWDEQNRVRDWQVLNTSRHYDEILKVAKYYRAEGMNDAALVMSLLFHQMKVQSLSECIIQCSRLPRWFFIFHWEVLSSGTN